MSELSDRHDPTFELMRERGWTTTQPRPRQFEQPVVARDPDRCSGSLAGPPG